MRPALHLLLCAWLLGLACGASAQSLASFRDRLAEPSTSPGAWGATVTVTEHGRAAQAVARATEENKRLRFKGFRVCIFFDNGQDARAGAEAARDLCMQTYPDTPVYISYTAPYFTVTVGDCVTAEEAIILMGRLRPTFPKAFPRSEELTVADLIERPVVLPPAVAEEP